MKPFLKPQKSLIFLDLFLDINFNNQKFLIHISEGSEVVKRTGLKILSLSEFLGSNPSPRILKIPKMKRKTRSQKIKTRARRGLKGKITQKKRNYVVDTSVIINKFLPRLIKKGLKGKIIIPNAVMAELENLANKGREEGFIGLEEVAKLHNYKQKGVRLHFQGIRPKEFQIRYARSGEIDALIRNIAKKNKAILITADLVQAKSAQAYGIQVLFLRPKIKIKKKRRFLFWKLQK